MAGPRVIFHADMDAFFASVEQHDNPDLRGKAVLVGGDGPRGVVTAASYEARVFGCHSAMPTAQARRLCPHAIVVCGRHERYRQVSDQVFAVFEEFTPLIEPLSIDEAFLDLTGSQRALGPPRVVGCALKERVRQETGLAVSVGIAPNKFLAKLASDLEKPDGLTVIEPDRVQDVLDPLPIRAIWGIGPAAEARLARLGITTIGQVRQMDLATLRARLGSFGERCYKLARGIDDRPVVPDHAARSIGHETTFSQDLADPDEVRTVLLRLAESVGRRLRKHDLRARTVTVKIRFGGYETITRSATLDGATNTTPGLWDPARGLFDRWAGREGFRPVRLIGVTASHLERPAGRQLGLFGQREEAKQRAVDAVADEIVRKYGKGAIGRGGAMKGG